MCITLNIEDTRQFKRLLFGNNTEVLACLWSTFTRNEDALWRGLQAGSHWGNTGFPSKSLKWAWLQWLPTLRNIRMVGLGLRVLFCLGPLWVLQQLHFMCHLLPARFSGRVCSGPQIVLWFFLTQRGPLNCSTRCVKCLKMETQAAFAQSYSQGTSIY